MLTVGSTNSNRDLTVNKSLTINGPGADLLTIKAFDPTPAQKNSDGSRVFNVSDGNFVADKTVTISGLTLTGGDVSGNTLSGGGGAVYNTERLTLDRVTIAANSARFGGGIRSAEAGSLIVSNSTVSGNSARNGGGIYADNNNSYGYGGSLHVSDSTINGNSATTGSGGGIRVNVEDFQLSGCTLSSNTAPNGSGGGINGFGTITSSTISGNTAVAGGGISGGGTITTSTISGNTATGVGGLGGGGIWGIGSITSSTVSGNSAYLGGGIYSVGSFSVLSTTISENTAGVKGGGIYSLGGSLMLKHSTVAKNVSNFGPDSGGGIYSTARRH